MFYPQCVLFKVSIILIKNIFYIIEYSKNIILIRKLTIASILSIYILKAFY